MSGISAHPATFRRRGSIANRRSIAPDMTPMVGLGLVLVAFFLINLNQVRPNSMRLTMPVKPPYDVVSCGSAMMLNLIVDKANLVHCYFGSPQVEYATALHTVQLSSAELRQLLLAARQENPDLVVAIKNTPQATYRDLVDALDEMNITRQKKYAVLDLNELNQRLLRENGL